MNEPMTDKERLLAMLTGIYEQLEELDSVFQASFSEQRIRLKQDEYKKITVPRKRISNIVNKLGKISPVTV